MVDHYLSPSVTRRVVLINKVIVPSIASTVGYDYPTNDKVPATIDSAFQRVMKLNGPLGVKNCRQVMASICNYLFPDSSTKLTTTPEVARFLHHELTTHTASYSDEIVRRMSDGTLMRHDILIARRIHINLGEDSSSYPLAPARSDAVTTDLLDVAAAHVYGEGKRVRRGTQADACLAVFDKSNSKNCFVFGHCGVGKTGIAALPQVALALNAAKARRCIFITPHNGLLSQHVQQMSSYFTGLGVMAKAISTDDFTDGSFPDIGDYNVLFVSIHMWNRCMEEHRAALISLKPDVVFVDEYHNAVMEIFRSARVWASLKNLPVLGAKIVCMSATATEQLIKCIASFMQLGEYEVIGNSNQYLVPDIAINIITFSASSIETELLSRASQYITNNPDKAMHIIVNSKDDATHLCEEFKKRGYSQSEWLTSDTDAAGRQDIMHRWSNGMFNLLISTLKDGIDSCRTGFVIMYRYGRSIVDVIQAAGRMRSGNQNGIESELLIMIDYTWCNFNPEGYNNDSDIELNITTLGAIGMLPRVGDAEYAKGKKMYVELFTKYGVLGWIMKNGCLRKNLYKCIGVESECCTICSICRKDDGILAAKRAADAALAESMTNVEFVLERMKCIFKYCYLCKSTQCGGLDCMPDRNYCHQCHGYNHRRSQCLAAPSDVFKNGNCCSGCYSRYDACSVQHRDTGQGGQCSLIRDRVKSLVLYKLWRQRRSDGGKEAWRLLVTITASKENWFCHMAEIFKLVDELHPKTGRTYKK